jgi:hypothetical protein
MTPSEKLLAFFRSEFLAEERSGFARLKRVPDSRVEESLGYYQSLSATNRVSWIDCCAHYALAHFGFVMPATRKEIRDLLAGGTQQALMTAHEEVYKERFDHTKHPFFPRWIDSFARAPFRSNRNVPMLRAAVSQYKMDRHRGVPSHVSEDLFQFAQSVQSVKAPELRKRVRSVLNRFGYQKTHQIGGHWCVWDGQEFEVNVDFGGRSAQLRYSVTPSELRAFHQPRFCFENALGMGFGDWNYIVEENVDDAFLLLQELIKYAVDLPKRMSAAV